MLNYTGNTVYLDVHRDAFVSGVTIYVESWSDRSRVFNHAGVLKMAAMIYWPDFGGYIWHYVTNAEVSDYDLLSLIKSYLSIEQGVSQSCAGQVMSIRLFIGTLQVEKR